MDDIDPRDHQSLMKGAKDMAREAKRQAAKKVSTVVDRASDEYSNSRSYQRFQDEDDGEYYDPPQGNYTAPDTIDEEGSSDATEGHDDEDEIYEGEYQGIPSESGHRDGHVALGQPVADGLKDRKELESERQADEEELAQQYELIIQECGHGRFQWQLYFTLGLALMSDGVEVFVVGFVLPSAETDMCMPDSSAGWLGSIVYIGMMVGALFWGGMSDKVGRRQCLLFCMSINGFFAFLSSFVQSYGLFLLCRMVAGFGIGGTVPIVFSYYAEVLAREKRGEHLSWLCMFWMIGEIYASAMAWAIIPHYGWSFSMGSAYQFHSWRVFVVVCALPCVCSVVALTFMPESPRFYLEVGKHDEAWMILKQIHDTNMRARGQPEKVFTVNRIKIPKQIDEFVEMHPETSNLVSRVIFRVKTELYGVRITDCCHFKDVTSVGSFFRNCTIIDSFFDDTDIDEYKLINTKVINSSFVNNKTGCQMTFDNDYSAYWVYFVNFLGTLAVLPGNIVSALLMDKTGRLSMLGFSMILSGISCFFLWFGTSEAMMIGMLCLYNGLSISAWNSLDVVTVELYPTDRRGTGFGFCNALCKLAAVLGNLIFGSLVSITKAIPILLASSVLVCGGLVGLRLPDTRSNVLM
ncbi:synaptic vesicle glycoprotein 2C isoform X1 [Silurus asotus]|uniref:Synaptic vesicle glycoprotein 2C isoform X1 n=1 Tax=Silurus asotus TaxID=30991 RepID=A0AAD5AC64_SILAS|nr:synaptic vesicle glycoprotein 2C isoform X1 [Silurus asotus]